MKNPIPSLDHPPYLGVKRNVANDNSQMNASSSYLEVSTGNVPLYVDVGGLCEKCERIAVGF